MKKLGAQPIAGVEEVNMFREDGNVLHFTAPKGEFDWHCVLSNHLLSWMRDWVLSMNLFLDSQLPFWNILIFCLQCKQ